MGQKRWAVGCLFVLVACSGPTDSPSSSPTSLFDSGVSDGGQSLCSEASKLVYVISADGDLHSFKPDQSKFAKIGHLNCATDSTPNSMAVDRSGTAWVNMVDGSLFKVSTKDAACQRTNYVPPPNWTRMGMGFSADSKGASSETLFVSSIGAAGGGKESDAGIPPVVHSLATINLDTLSTKIIQAYSGDLADRDGELTGTGDGSLYGFFRTEPSPSLVMLGKSDASSAKIQPLDGLETGGSYAFSFWGGDFWFYTSVGLKEEPTSRVTRLKTSGDGSLSVYMTNIGFTIVGAGVSTCAPTRPPA